MRRENSESEVRGWRRYVERCRVLGCRARRPRGRGRARAERHRSREPREAESERAERGIEGERERAPLELIRLQVEHTHHILKGIAVRLVEDKEDARLCGGRHKRESKQASVSEPCVRECGLRKG